uniref:Retrovirus-related Pol polyprotein from transposon TNT 1-94 n=1 Tax=Tanacetum cinerariifolium TaxID=118510 RepID=A0A6L2LH31_TANCI|nr:retrovirus-related Pol polyprotein from transposon TNT 1-94 [Tanacetum cinerariifolium]
MLNKENYVPWSSHLLQYANSRPNGKLIHNSIINGPYVRRMIPEPCDPNREVPTILLGLPEDIYAAVDSCETAQEIWLRVQQMMKGSNIGIQEKKAKLFNEWERFTSNDGESTESYYYRFLKLMNDLKRNKHFREKITMFYQDQPSFNQNYMQQPMPNPEDITIPTTVINMALALMAKAFKLNYSTPTNNNQRISSNPRNRQIAQPRMNMGQDKQMQMVGGDGGNQFRQYAGQNVGNLNGYNDVQNVRNQNPNGNGNLIAARAKGNANGHNGNQIRYYNYRGVADLDEIEEVNANYILMANLQQASTSGTQTDKAPVYDSDGSTEVHNYENCYDNKIFNMFTQEEQYTGLLEPIPEPHQVQQIDNNVISEVSSVEQSGRIVEQHPANVEETRILYDSLYHKLAIKVEKVNTVNHKLKETNVELTTELARFKNQEKYFEISQEKYDKLERCYQKSVYQEQCLSKKINSLHLNSEETLQLAQESHLKMKQLNKEIKPANNTKINHLSRVFVTQMAKSREELYFSNNSKTANVSKPISIPNEEFSDDTTPSVVRKFQNEVKSTIVTLQRVVKQRMTLETHNWSSSAHQELHKIIKDEIFPIVNQVDARAQNFEIHFLKEAAKFVGDFKYIAKEADESLAKHKALELEIERLLRAVVSQDIMSVVQNNSVVETSNLHNELERTKERFENYIIKKENEYAKLWNDWYKKCEECKFDKISYDRAYNDMQKKIERLQAQLGDLKEFQVLNYAKENAHLKTTYKNLFNSISVTRTQNKTLIDSLQNKLQDMIYENAKLRAQLFDKVFDQKDTACGKSLNTKFAKQSILGKPPKVGKTYALSNPVTSNSILISQESKVMKNDKVIQICLWCVDSGCSKHMTGNLQLLINFVWMFLGTVRFKNDHVASILGFSDLQWGNILITRVYFVEGLGHNLFSVGHFCDSDLEVAFRRNACFVRNLKGVYLLKRDRLTNLYTINLPEMASASPIFHMARASSTKSWLWHQCLSHFNFVTINDLAKNDLVFCLPKFKYHKEHLCPSYEQGKSKRASHPPKPVPNSRQRLHLLHMDLCGPMRIANINGKRVYNQRTKKIMETMNVSFDELSAMDFEQSSSKPRLQSMTSRQITMYDDYIGGQPSAALRTVLAVQAHQVHQTLMTSTSIADTTPTPTISSSQATKFPNTSQDVDELNSQQQHAQQQGNQAPI